MASFKIVCDFDLPFKAAYFSPILQTPNIYRNKTRNTLVIWISHDLMSNSMAVFPFNYEEQWVWVIHSAYVHSPEASLDQWFNRVHYAAIQQEKKNNRKKVVKILFSFLACSFSNLSYSFQHSATPKHTSQTNNHSESLNIFSFQQIIISHSIHLFSSSITPKHSCLSLLHQTKQHIIIKKKWNRREWQTN